MHIALMAKEKGFNEPCLAYYCQRISNKDEYFVRSFEIKTINYDEVNEGTTLAIIYQQLVDWFREKHKIFITHDPMSSYSSLGACAFSIDNPNKPGFYRSHVAGTTYYNAFNNALMHAFTLI